MPELPEVHTTVQGLNEVLKGATITDVWSGYKSSFHAGKENIKNPDYFKMFKKTVIGRRFLAAERRGKNILIHVAGGKTGRDDAYTILIHMKMTGHLMYGRYEYSPRKNVWAPAPDERAALHDPFNQHIRLVFTVSGRKNSDSMQLAFSDLRKFAKVFVFPTSERDSIADLAHLGPEPLETRFTFALFKERLMKRPRGKIKQVLMDQTVVAGIGNIYSDEILWEAGVHPLSQVEKIPTPRLRAMFEAMKLILRRGIDFGGDSDSDYRNIHGEPGRFQHKHSAYRRTGKPCPRPRCSGTIERLKIGGRSTHFCPKHQKMFT